MEAVGEMPVMAKYERASNSYGAEALMASTFEATRQARRVAPEMIVGGTIPTRFRDIQQEMIMAMPPNKPVMRVVQVFIVDPDPKMPLADRLLHEGESHLTDKDDQELFFDLDIKTMLAEHNKKRTAVVDKSVKDRTEHLEPARIRDLKMTVVDVATF